MGFFGEPLFCLLHVGFQRGRSYGGQVQLERLLRGGAGRYTHLEVGVSVRGGRKARPDGAKCVRGILCLAGDS